MKKNLLLLTIFMLISLSSCTVARIKIPYGVWESITPSIIAYISPDIQEEDIVNGNTFTATYVTEAGETKDLSVLFNKIDGRMMIHEKILLEDGSARYDIYFSGDFKVIKDTLIMYVVNQRFAGTDYDQIVFTKIQDYEDVPE